MNQTNFTQGLAQAWTNFMVFLPKFLLALAIVVVGYLVAKVLCRGLSMLLQRVGFDRLVERGGIKQVLAKTPYDPSTLLGKILFYCVCLVALQFAFGVFGPNPVSEILNRLVYYLPNIFIAVLIVIVVAAVAMALKDILQATLAGLSFGKVVANVVAAFIVAVGVFAALNQLGIAPAIVNGLFYAMLAIVAGSAIVAIGGGGIVPMRGQWEKMLDRVERQAAAAPKRGSMAGSSTEPAVRATDK